MTAERWRQVEEVFHTVVERAPSERDVCLTRMCGDDAELRREVESLLAYELTQSLAHQPFEAFEAAVKGAARSLTTAPGDQLIGGRIGAYRITGLIGHGGMGAVYLAARDDAQFEQQVAI